MSSKLYNMSTLNKYIKPGLAMPLHTKVKVPGGWSTTGALKLNDLVVTPDGKFVPVTGINPQGITDNYTFLFEDGRTAESHPLHQWAVYEDMQHQTMVTTTLDILNHFSEFEYSIPLVGRVGSGMASLSAQELVDISHQLLTGVITFDKVEELNYEDRLTIVLTMIEYQDGEHTVEGVELSTQSDIAAYTLRELIWSLGGIVFMGETEPYHLKILQRDIRNPHNLVSDTINQKTKSLKLVGITKGDPVETVCISIGDEDKLYIIGDYLVTHNGDC